MSGLVLKLIAVITMAIDHTAVVVISYTSLMESFYFPMRKIGRIAFPIYCFLLVEGMLHTRNIKKYMARMAIFALISEIPFDLAVFGTYFNYRSQNVFLTLLLGLMVLAGLKKAEQKLSGDTRKERILYAIASIFIIILGCYIAEEIRCDYGAFGVVLIVIFYLLRNNKSIMVCGVTALFCLYNIINKSTLETYGLLALLPIWFYNGKKGTDKFPKYVFYAFYPVHLLCLVVIRTII